jgi:hypothetical protein
MSASNRFKRARGDAKRERLPPKKYVRVGQEIVNPFAFTSLEEHLYSPQINCPTLEVLSRMWGRCVTDKGVEWVGFDEFTDEGVPTLVRETLVNARNALITISSPTTADCLSMDCLQYLARAGLPESLVEKYADGDDDLERVLHSAVGYGHAHLVEWACRNQKVRCVYSHRIHLERAYASRYYDVASKLLEAGQLFDAEHNAFRYEFSRCSIHELARVLCDEEENGWFDEWERQVKSCQLKGTSYQWAKCLSYATYWEAMHILDMLQEQGVVEDQLLYNFMPYASQLTRDEKLLVWSRLRDVCGISSDRPGETPDSIRFIYEEEDESAMDALKFLVEECHIRCVDDWIREACECGALRVVKYLASVLNLEENKTLRRSLLMQSMEHGHTDIFRQLLGNFDDPSDEFRAEWAWACAFEPQEHDEELMTKAFEEYGPAFSFESISVLVERIPEILEQHRAYANHIRRLVADWLVKD